MAHQKRFQKCKLILFIKFIKFATKAEGERGNADDMLLMTLNVLNVLNNVSARCSLDLKESSFVFQPFWKDNLESR